MPNRSIHKRPLGIDELNANHYRVSVHKYGFFLCRKGHARILLGDRTFLISENHLCIYTSSIIRAKSGKTALQWIENVTMTYARQYLDDPEASIKQVAERLNFPDQSTFGRYFRHREGCSPSEYRNINKHQ